MGLYIPTLNETSPWFVKIGSWVTCAVPGGAIADLGCNTAAKLGHGNSPHIFARHKNMMTFRSISGVQSSSSHVAYPNEKGNHTQMPPVMQRFITIGSWMGVSFSLFLELGQIMNPIRFVYWWIHPTIGTSSFLLWKTCCTNIHFPTFRFAVPLATLMTTRGKLEENSLRSSACNMYMLHVALLAASMSEDMLDSTTRALVRWHFDLQQQLFGCAFKWAPQCFCRSSWTWTRTKWWAHREQEHIPIKVSSIDWEETAPTATSLKLTHPKHDAWKTTAYFPLCNGTCMCCDVSNILLQCHPTPFHTYQTPSLVAYLHILLPTQIRFF